MQTRLSLWFSPRGRVGRGPFWWAYAAQGAVAVAFVAVAIFVIDAEEGDPSIPVLALEVGLFVIYLICVAAVLALGIKRFHDRGKSGWWTLVSFVPLIGGLWYLKEVG